MCKDYFFVMCICMMVGLFTWIYVLIVLIWIYTNKCCYSIPTNIYNDVFLSFMQIFKYLYI